LLWALRSALSKGCFAASVQRVLLPFVTDVLNSTPLDVGKPGAEKLAPVVLLSALVAPALALSTTEGRHKAAACCFFCGTSEPGGLRHGNLRIMRKSRLPGLR